MRICGGRALGEDPSAGEHDDVVADARDERQVVVDDEHAGPDELRRGPHVLTIATLSASLIPEVGSSSRRYAGARAAALASSRRRWLP